MRHLTAKKFQSQSGVHLVLLAFFLSVLLILCSLAIGIGFMVLDNIKFQNTTNAAAIAAMNAFLEQGTSQRNPQSTSPTAQQRVDNALSAAKSVFRDNRFYSGTTYIADNLYLSTGSSSPDTSKIEFGTWHTQEGTGPGQDYCSKNYPCFIAGNPVASADSVNAIRISAKTSETDTLIAPFAEAAGVLTGGKFKVNKESFAVTEPKCTSILLDVSNTSFQDSHEFSVGPGNSTLYDASTGVISYPFTPGVFAYDAAAVTGFSCSASGGPNNLQAGENATLNAYWCSAVKAANRSTGPALHAASDFKTVSTRRGLFLADVYTRPEPLRTYMDSINGFLQDYSKTIGFQDKLVAYVFDDMNSTMTPTGFVDRIPEYGTGTNSYPTLNETGFLAQLFNIENIGTSDDSGNYLNQVHPNMLDRGWFPDVSNSNSGRSSNLPLAIRRVMGEMNTFCPANSIRSIVVASSGVFKRGYTDDGSGNPAITPLNTFTDYKNFIDTRILSQGPYQATDSVWQRSILYDALQWGISLSFISGGQKLQPNFCNRKDSSGKFIPLSNMLLDGNISAENSTCSIGATKSLALTSDSYSSAGSRPACGSGLSASECAFRNYEDSAFDPLQPSQNTYFRYPNHLFAKLSFDSGGLFCPLMLKAPDSEYKPVTGEEQAFTPDQLDSNTPPYKRVENEPQYYRTDNLSNTAMGSACLRNLTSKGRVHLIN